LHQLSKTRLVSPRLLCRQHIRGQVTAVQGSSKLRLWVQIHLSIHFLSFILLSWTVLMQIKHNRVLRRTEWAWEIRKQISREFVLCTVPFAHKEHEHTLETRVFGVCVCAILWSVC
jgi:hypothetical protein